MVVYFSILIFYLTCILMCTFGFERSMLSSVDYWSDKQYKLLQILCATIGGIFFVAIVLVCLLSENKFSTEMNKICLALSLSGFVLMVIFSQVIHLVAYRRKKCYLYENIKMTIHENELADVNKILDKCIRENRFHFTEKEIERCFKKVLNEYNNNCNP